MPALSHDPVCSNHRKHVILFLVSLALGALNADAGAGCIVDGLQSSYRQRPVSSSQLVSQAKQLVLRQEARFQRYFEDTGFADQAAFDDAVRVYSEPAAMLADWLQNEKHIEFATNVPESARSAISGKGFRNLRATDGPVANAEEIELRDLVEAVKSGYSPREYKTFDADLKPSYGYLKPGPDSGLIPSQLASHYGDDTYIFKKGRVRDRLTWTAGDSFGPARYANGKTQPENWRDFFVPWKNRTLMIPDILDAVSLQKTGFSAEFVNGTGAPMPPPRPLLSFEPKAPPKSRLPYPLARGEYFQLFEALCSNRGVPEVQGRNDRHCKGHFSDPAKTPIQQTISGVSEASKSRRSAVSGNGCIRSFSQIKERVSARQAESRRRLSREQGVQIIFI